MEDTKQTEYKYIYRKFGNIIDQINLEARNSFKQLATLSVLKSSIKFNHYTMWDM